MPDMACRRRGAQVPEAIVAGSRRPPRRMLEACLLSTLREATGVKSTLQLTRLVVILAAVVVAMFARTVSPAFAYGSGAQSGGGDSGYGAGRGTTSTAPTPTPLPAPAPSGGGYSGYGAGRGTTSTAPTPTLQPAPAPSGGGYSGYGAGRGTTSTAPTPTPQPAPAQSGQSALVQGTAPTATQAPTSRATSPALAGAPVGKYGSGSTAGSSSNAKLGSSSVGSGDDAGSGSNSAGSGEAAPAPSGGVAVAPGGAPITPGDGSVGAPARPVGRVQMFPPRPRAPRRRTAVVGRAALPGRLAARRSWTDCSRALLRGLLISLRGRSRLLPSAFRWSWQRQLRAPLRFGVAVLGVR